MLAALPPPPPALCANCGAPVGGEYCAQCGQRVEPHIHTVWGFAREATESLTHADSRLWQTLSSLLLRPGFLTCEFLRGRRARYLPPFRLYLVVSVLFFVLASLLGDDDFAVQVASVDGVAAPVTIGSERRAREGIRELRREVEQAARTSTGAAERAVAEKAGEIVTAVTSSEPSAACELTYDGPGKSLVAPLGPRFRAGCLRATADGGRSLGRSFMANVPHMLILFLPFIALLMKLLYWRPRRYYVEHLLFFVHNHAFVFVLFGLLMILSAPLPAGVSGLATLAAFAYCLWYFFRAMRVVYAQSRARTFAKYAVLAVTYLVCGVLLTVITLAYSVITS